MLAGTEFALRGMDSARRGCCPGAVASRRTSGLGRRWAMLLAGAVLIVLSSQVKLPSLLALGFVTMALACRCGGNLRAFLLAGGGDGGAVAGGDGVGGLGQRAGLRLDLHAGHRQRRAQLDVAADAARAGHRAGRAFCWAWAITPPRCWR